MKEQTPATAPRRAVLHGSPASPFVRKVRIALAEKSVEYEWSRDYYEFLDELNPLGKVPVLVDGTGRKIFDSRVICEWLDIHAPEPRLLPAAPRGRMEVKRWEALADGICDAAVAIIVERKRELSPAVAETFIDHQTAKVERGIAWAARELADSYLCFGADLTLADVALFCALRYTSFRLKSIPWRRKHPTLARYCDRLESRAAFAATAPEAANI